MWCIHMQIEIEKRGIPTVSINTKPFIRDAQASAEMYGIPKVRRVFIPHPIAGAAEKETPRKIKAVFDELVNGLVSPLTDEELKTVLQKAKKRERIVFTGTLEQVHSKFTEMGLSDGLPIIPPTEEKVAKMLKGTSHSPEEVIGKMAPENWEVTVEKVTINGVMAGCLPEYMPVLLAIAEALIDPRTETETFARSTSSFAFWSVVNGPIAKEIGMNCKINALGSGNRANATIGRAIRLFLINLGGSQPGVNDMSSQGNALKYGFSFAENETESPWAPFHVTHGFNPKDSVVTVFKSWGFRSTALTGIDSFGLPNIAWTAKNIDGSFGQSLPRGILILIDPLLAKQLAKDGLNKKDIQKYLWQSLHRPVQEWKGSFRYSLDLRDPLFPKWYEQLAPDVMIPKFVDPDCIEIIVVGGQTNPFYQTFEGVSPASGTSKSVDKWK